MADEVTTRILEIKTTYADAVKGLSDYMAKLEEARQAEADLRKAIQESGEATEEDRKTLAAIKSAQREYSKGVQALTKEIQNNIKMEKQQEGSLTSLRAELSNATKAYDDLSETERNGAQGQAMAAHINEITDKLKAAEEGTQRFYRNVGNYQNAITSALSAGNPFIKQMIQMTAGAKGAGGAFQSLGVAAKGFGTTLKALLANPVVLVLSGIAKAVQLVSNAMKSSEELTQRWNVVLAPLKRMMADVTKVLQTAVGWITSAVEGAAKLESVMDTWLERIPGIGKKIAEVNEQNRQAIDLANEKNAIEKETRTVEEQNAKDDAEISRLRNEAQDKENYTAEERLAKLQRANDLEAAELKRNKDLAERRLAVLEEESKWNQNSKELNDQITEARIAVYNADKEYEDGTRRLQRSMQSTRKEIAADEKSAADERQRQIEAEMEARERQAAAELADIQKATDMRIAAMEEGYEKEVASENETFGRELADLQKRLDTEMDMTVAQRAAVQEQVELLTRTHTQKLADLDAQRAADEAAAEAERAEAERRSAQTTLELRLQLAEKGSAEELELRKQQVQMEMEERLADETLTDEQIAMIRQLYQTQLLAMDAQFYQSELDAQKKAKQEAIKIETQKMTAIAGVFSNLSDIMDQFGEDNKAAAVASKVLALGQIAVETGVAIANGVAQAAAAGPWPANLAAIATTVATVLAEIASAVSTVKGASFATGGIVSGPGTGTSDSVSARLSNGESVNTALATAMFAPLYSALNQLGGGQAYTGGGAEQYGEDVLARAFARGAACIRPVVSVKEITDTQSRVAALEKIGRA
ncbi:MAG: hypothetical protein LUC33_00890 [Prevotellaceae bacterium]|nr:hypothetical protein [Prevotellaceae bacterium]